jgi:hypothetical protein
MYSSLKKKVKYIRINLTKDVNELFKEKFQILKKEIKEDSEGPKISHAHGFGKINKKRLYYQKQYTCSAQFSSKSQWHSLQRLKNLP